MALSKQVAIELWRAKRTHNLILEFYPRGTTVGSIRNRFFLVLCDLSLEHLASIAVLVSTSPEQEAPAQHQGSAFALLRPLIETVLRAAWILHVAGDGQIEGIARGGRGFPAILAVSKAVSAHFHAETGKESLFEVNKVFLDQLHGLTHSGIEQIMKRFGPDLQIRPSYPDDDVSNLLDQASRWAVMGAILNIQQVDGTDRETAPAVEELTKRFLELLEAEP